VIICCQNDKVIWYLYNWLNNLWLGYYFVPSSKVIFFWVQSLIRVASHYGLAIYIKNYLKAKEELRKFKCFITQKYNLKIKSSKGNQNLSRYHNSITNLKFQHKPKYHLFKNPHIKIDLVPKGQSSLSYYTL